MNLTYGKVAFDPRLINTIHFDQEPVYAEDGFTYKYTHFKIAIQTVLSLLDLPESIKYLLIQNDTKTTSAAVVMAAIRNLLLQPRQQLKFTEGNGDILLVSPAAPGDKADATGGPKTTCNVIQIMPQTLIVDFTVETDLPTCSASDPSVVLANRWGWTTTIDQSKKVTREITGTLSLSKRMDTNPDSLRSLVLPQIPKGFVRQDTRFTVQPDGLALSYSFRDVQQYLVPPILSDGTQASKASGRMTVGSGDGVVTWNEISIHLEGPINVDKARLFQWASQMVLAYLGNGADLGANTIVEASEFGTELFENTVDVRVRVKRTDSKINIYGFADANLTKQPPGTEKGVALDPGTHGTWLANTLHAKLTDQDCSGTTGKPTEQSAKSTPGGSDGTGYTPPVVKGASYIDTTTPAWSSSNSQALYNEYDIQSSYVQKTNTFLLAVGDPNGSPEIVTLACPVWVRIVAWSADRNVQNPQLPGTFTNDNEVLVKAKTNPQAPKLNGDAQTRSNKCSGVYYYLLKKPPQQFTSGKLPYDSATSVGTISRASFITGLI